MTATQIIQDTFEKGGGVLRLAPNFVPRRNSDAGRRLRLHPDDYYALGMKRGSIKERWFSSVIVAMNGPLAPADEGLSYVAPSDNLADKFPFRDAVDELGAAIIGEELKRTYGTWPMYSKFFDYNPPLFFHLHLSDEKAALVGMKGKPEAYYFPPQLNNHPGEFPVTYFGFDPTVSKDEVRQCLLDFEKRDTRITRLSRAFRLEVGTGWYTPPGVLHAPGSYLTYEPQWNSDVNSIFENVTLGEINPYSLLVENVPTDKKLDIDFVMSLLDWEANVDPDYRRHYFRPPLPAAQEEGKYSEQWIVYGNPYFSGKELTVLPGQTAVIKDVAAYGCIQLQGHGKFGVHDCEAASMLRYGQLSADEFFVSEQAAREGVTIVNQSKSEPIVLLKHFGPNVPNAPSAPL